MYRQVRFVLVFIWCCLISGSASTSQASPVLQEPVTPAVPASTYDGLNLLFVIDQSGSMGGTSFNGPALYGVNGNDPLKLRFAGPQTALNWLSDFQWTMVSDSKLPINVGLVAFGSYPRLLLDWTPIETGNPGWDSRLNTLYSDLSAERFGPTNLGDTDFNRAFTEAQTYFPLLSTRIPPGAKYLNAIVVLTDGAPCSGNDPGFQETQTDANGVQRIVYNCIITNPRHRAAMEDHLRWLDSFVTAQFPGDTYEMYVIGLDAVDTDPVKEFWVELEGLWSNVVCDDPADCDPAVRYARVTGSAEIGSQLRLILNDVIQRVSPNVSSFNVVAIPPGTFTVKPYQQLLRIDVFKTDDQPLSGFSVNSPSGASTARTSGETTPIQSFSYTFPEAGQWFMSAGNAGQITRVTTETITAGVQIDPVATGEIFSPLPLTLRLVQGNGTPLTASPSNRFPLTMTALIYDATLIDPEARPKVAEVALTQDIAASSIYQFNGSWTPQTPGVYEVRLNATYVDDTGATQALITEQTIINTVPVAGSYVEWNGVTPSTERVDKSFIAEAVARNADTGQPIANTSALVIRVNLTNADGTPYNTVILPNEAAAEAGVLRSGFKIDQPGSYSAQLEAGVVDANGNFIQLGNASIPQILTVRALHPLKLVFQQPSTDQMEAQRLSLLPFEFTLSTPVTVQVALVDELTGNWVAISEATGGTATRPTVVLNPGGDSIDLTAQLIEVQPGIYTTQVEGLGMGGFTFTASVDVPSDALTGDYVWGAQQTSQSLTRVIAPALLLAVGGLILVLAVLTIGFLFMRWWTQRVSEAPLRGMLTFYMITSDGKRTNEEVIGRSLSLEIPNRPRNTRVFKGDSLPKPFEYLKVSTRRSEDSSKKGYAYIEQLRVNGRDITLENTANTLRPERKIVVAQSPDGLIEYAIGKDVGDLDFGNINDTIFRTRAREES